MSTFGFYTYVIIDFYIIDDNKSPAFGPLALLSPPFSRREKGFSSLALRERDRG